METAIREKFNLKRNEMVETDQKMGMTNEEQNALHKKYGIVNFV